MIISFKILKSYLAKYTSIAYVYGHYICDMVDNNDILKTPLVK